MSKVYFHRQNGEPAKLSGAERAWANHVVGNIATGFLDADEFNHSEQLKQWLPTGHYLRSASIASFRESYESAFRAGFRDPLIVKDGVELNSWRLALNTAMVVGNDQVRFLARLHGQCEIHAYVLGPNRRWLAELITEGRRCGLYRPQMGWEDVIAVLLAGATWDEGSPSEPIVLSYSVGEGFPNATVSDFLPAYPAGVSSFEQLTRDQQEEWTKKADGWYELPEGVQWERSLRALTTKSPSLELKPEGFSDYRFGDGLSLLDLFEQ